MIFIISLFEKCAMKHRNAYKILFIYSKNELPSLFFKIDFVMKEMCTYYVIYLYFL